MSIIELDDTTDPFFIKLPIKCVIEKEVNYKLLLDDTTDPFLIKKGYVELPIQCENDESYTNQIPIEKILHFIWVGRVIPEKYKDTVIQSKQINQHYEVILWVDNTSITNSIQQELELKNIIVKNIYKHELYDNPDELKREITYLLNLNS